MCVLNLRLCFFALCTDSYKSAERSEQRDNLRRISCYDVFFTSQRLETAIKRGLKSRGRTIKICTSPVRAIKRSVDGALVFWVRVNSAIRTVCLEPVRKARNSCRVFAFLTESPSAMQTLIVDLHRCNVPEICSLFYIKWRNILRLLNPLTA